jgi:cytochrome c oxidase subunit 2
MERSKLSIVAICLLVVSLAVGTASVRAQSEEAGQVIKITAKRFEYNPNEITVKKGVPVTLEFTSLDRLHGFSCPDLGIRTDIPPGKASRIRFVPEKTGTFDFHCDIFCGEGHENMTGKIIVTK